MFKSITAKSIFCYIAISSAFTISYAEQYDVGIRNDGIPYILINEQGIPSGFDMDIIQAIADDQDFDINVRINDFADLMPGIDSGTFDLVIGAITITDERKLKYNFSEPYIEDYVGVLTITPDLDVSSIDEIAKLRVVVEQGTLYKTSLEEIGVEPLVVNSVFLGIKAVAQDKADALIHDEYIIAHAIKGYGEIDFNLERLDSNGFFPDNKLGIVVEKGNVELLNKINQGLANIQANGIHEKITTKWDMH